MEKTNNFENKIKAFFKELKNSKRPLEVEIIGEGKKVGVLEFVTINVSQHQKIIMYFAKWRRNSQWYFPSQFKVTIPGTRIWAKKSLIDKEDRILFLIKDMQGKLIGHIGLYSFDFKNETCEIDNVVRGEKGTPGIMTSALNALINWTFENLRIKDLYLRVFSDNQKAISLYERCNFSHENLIPLKKRVENSTVFWEETFEDSIPEKSFLKMKYIK